MRLRSIAPGRLVEASTTMSGARWSAPLALTIFVIPFAAWAVVHPHREGDTVVLVHGADAARACLADSQFTGCPGVIHFPLFQYLPSIVLGALGVPDSAIVHVLATLSTCSFAAVLFLTWRIVRRRAGAGAAAVAVGVVAAGPLLVYVPSSFGELLASLLILLFVDAILARRSFVGIAGTFWLAGITKETAFPFLLALGLAALLGTTDQLGYRAMRGPLAALVVGAALAVVTNAAFNVFRFDSVRNVPLLQPIYRVPGVERRAELALGLWASPNGGMLIFWPAAVLIVGATVLHGLCTTGLRRWPAVLLLAVAAGLTAGFASWAAPFGWFAWGSRLMMPWIPALVVLALAIYPAPATSLAGWIGRSRTRRVGTGLLAAVLALPHLAALFPSDPQVRDALVRLFATDATCPVPPIIEKVTRAYYYGCINHWAWEKTPVWLNSLRAARDNSAGVFFSLLLVVSFVSAALVAPFGRRSVGARA
jgi:hypothetical protein